MIQKLIEEIDIMIEKIHNTEPDTYKLFSTLLAKISKIYKEFIEIIPKLNEIGMEISIEGVTSQLVTLAEAIKVYDKVEIYDCLKYEIRDTLIFYNEILTIMNE